MYVGDSPMINTFYGVQTAVCSASINQTQTAGVNNVVIVNMNNDQRTK